MYKREIEDLQDSIKSARNAIKSTRENMARQRASKAPKHYQESGRRNIEHQKKLIKDYQKKIAKYRENKKNKSMGKGVDSFKREIGKNAGKWVSNKVFGDGHSTPHRVNINSSKKSEINYNEESLLNTGKKIFSESLKEVFEDKGEIKKINIKKEDVINKSIPNETDEIMNLVNQMLSNIKSNGWKFGNNDEHINSFSDACLTKLELCSIKLKSINEIQQFEYLEIEIKKLKKKRLFQKYAIWVGFGFMFIIGFILYKLGIIK